MTNAKKRWYENGLRFACTQCGHCCTGEPGYVWLDDAEVEELARLIGEKPERFLEIYTRKVGSRNTLIEMEDGACVFYRPGLGCTVYDQRPKQCRTWPFWNSNIESRESWDEAASGCPGIGRGPVFSVEEIVRQSRVIDI